MEDKELDDLFDELRKKNIIQDTDSVQDSMPKYANNINKDFRAENNNYLDNDAFKIVTDPLTGVEYITNKCNGFNADYGSAICVRVDRNGKPIINPDWIERQKQGY